MEKTRGHGYKLHRGVFILMQESNWFTVRTISHCNNLLKGIVMSLSQEVPGCNSTGSWITFSKLPFP